MKSDTHAYIEGGIYMKKLWKKNEFVISSYFNEHKDEINCMLDALNTAFYRTLNAIYGYRTTCYVKVNQQGKLLYHIGDVSSHISALTFVQAYDRLEKRVIRNQEPLLKELLSRMLGAYKKVIDHFINLCLNPVCVYFDMYDYDNSCDEYCNCYCSAMRYRDYYEDYKVSHSYDISPAFEYDCLKYFLSKDYTLYFTDNESLKQVFVKVVNNADNFDYYDDDTYEFAPCLEEISEKMTTELLPIPISVPFDVQRVVVGASYYPSDDDIE